MGNKTGLITPFLMLTAGAIASVIMYVREFELTRMLWTLLIVLIIFYIIGDIARYLYASIRPTIIPELDERESQLIARARAQGEVIPLENGEAEDSSSEEFVSSDAEEFMTEDTDTPENMDFGEGYSDEELEYTE